MKKIKTVLACSLAGAMGLAATAAGGAVLQSGDRLTIGVGSWFWLGGAGQTNVGYPTDATFIEPGTDGGLLIGSPQAVGDIDAWTLSGIDGGHYTLAAPAGSTESGLDFSGWHIFWNGQSQTEAAVDEGFWTPANCETIGCTGVTFADGVAAFAWTGVYGDAYSLWYSWAFNPVPGCFGCSQNYLLHLEGVVLSAVPLPPALWLLGSGLVGLLGLSGVTSRRGR